MKADLKGNIRGFLVFMSLFALVFMGAQCTHDKDDHEGHAAGEHMEAGHDHGEHAGDEHEGHDDHSGHEGHGHGEGSDMDMSLAEVGEAVCEHEVRAYHCDECRYEVGVVRVSKDVVDDSGNGDGLVSFGPASSGGMETTLTTTGEVRLNTNRTVRMSVPVSGVVEAVEADLGDVVEDGEVVYSIRSTELAETVGDYLRASDLVRLSRKNYERERDLYRKKISSEAELINAEMAFQEHQAELKAVRQKLLALGLEEDSIDGKLRDEGILEVRAPIMGTVIEKDVAINENADPGDGLMVVSDLGTLWAWADIYERDLSSLMESGGAGELPARIKVRSFQGRTFDGTVDYIGATMDEATRTVKVRITVDNSEGLLRPGMFCDVSIPLKISDKVVLVPRDAVLSDEGQNFVFKHLRGDYWVRRHVTTGREFGEKLEIISGISPGEVIATEGAFLLKSDVLREKMGAGCAD